MRKKKQRRKNPIIQLLYYSQGTGFKMEILSFSLCWCRVVCQVTWKMIGRTSCFIIHRYILHSLMSYLNLIFQGMVSYNIASFPLTALAYNWTQFPIRNRMVISAYLTQTFLKHELLLLSFCFRFLMQITTTTKQAKLNLASSARFKTIYNPFTWL